MSQIPVIQSVVNQMITDYIVDGKVLPNGQVSYKGGIVSARFLNGIVPEANKTVLMTKVNNQWYVIGIETPIERLPVFAFSFDFNVLEGSTFTRSISSTHWFATHAFQTTPAVNNSAKNRLFLIKGTYIFRIYTVNATNRGISAWYLGNNLIYTHNAYAAVETHTILEQQIEVPYTGYHDIKYVVTGKHASSTNFFYSFSAIAFLPA